MTRLRRAAQASSWRAAWWLTLLWFALLWLGAAAPAQAHRSGESQFDLRIDGDQIQAHRQITVHDLGRADPTAATLADLAQARAWLAARPDLPARLGALLGLQAGGLLRPAVFTADSPVQVFSLRAPNTWERLRDDVQSASGTSGAVVTICCSCSACCCLLLPSVQRRGPAGIGGASAGRALALVLTDVARIVTAFTLAHSFTLGLAALQLVQLPERFTESAIAASVLLAAAINLRTGLPLQRWQAAFAFGLVHGFGFASAVAILALPGTRLLPTLLGFNLGVELGPLAVVAAALPLGLAAGGRRWYGPVVVRGGSCAVGTLALLWLLERAVGLQVLASVWAAVSGR